ncbi:MAG: type II secretion system F family protein [Candidatus Hadarchaeales archaeon]
MARKKGGFLKFLSAIGNFVVKTGEATTKIAQVSKAAKPVKPKDEVARRLEEIKQLELLREEDRREAMKLEMEEKKWEERVELKRPLSERLSDIFYGVLKKPATRLADSMKGLSTDLYRANIKIPPEKFAAYIIGVSIIVTVIAVGLLVMLRAPFVFLMIGSLLSFLFSFMFAKSYPGRRARARSVEVNRTLPFALRHMATQLASGIGLPETMVSVSKAKYGALSEEFERAINDMNAGMSMEEALAAMDMRVNSEPLRRAIRQIQRTLRTGGDISKTLNSLADDTAFEMRMKLRDYVQSLNMMTLLYMFLSAVVPSMLMVVFMISARGGSGGLSPSTAAVFYLILLPFLLVYFVLMIKRFEPRL